MRHAWPSTIALFSSWHLRPVLNLGSGTREVLESPMSTPCGRLATFCPLHCGRQPYRHSKMTRDGQRWDP